MRVLGFSLLFTVSVIASPQKEQLAKVPNKIRAQLEIQIPRIEAKNAPLSELLEFVSQRIQEQDQRQPRRTGISFLSKSEANDEMAADDVAESGGLLMKKQEKTVDYSASNVAVFEVLQFIADSFDAEFHVTNVGIIITSVDGAAFPNGKSDTGHVYYRCQPKLGEQSVPPKSDRAGG